MTDEQAKAIVAMLCGAWPTAKQNNPQTLQVYVGALRPLSFDHAFLAADRLVRTSRFWPAAAEIVEAAQRVADEERIEAEKAAPLLPDGRGGAKIPVRFQELYRQTHGMLIAGAIGPLEHAMRCRQIAADMHLSDSVVVWDKRIAELQQDGARRGNALAGVAW